MSMIKQLAFRDGRIVHVGMTPGKGGIETQIKIHAPIDADTAETIGATMEDIEGLESAKLRFRLLATKANLVGVGNLSKYKAEIPDCEAVRFCLKPTGDLGDGNAKSEVVHVTFTLTYGRPNPEVYALLEAIGNGPMLVTLKGDAEAQQQDLPLDPVKAAAAAAEAKRKAAGGEVDPAEKVKVLYEAILQRFQEEGAELPAHTRPLANASRPDLARVVKRAEETSEKFGGEISGLVDQVLVCREQIKGRASLQKV